MTFEVALAGVGSLRRQPARRSLGVGWVALAKARELFWLGGGACSAIALAKEKGSCSEWGSLAEGTWRAGGIGLG